MKKILAFVIASMLACTAAFALVGCGGSDFAGEWGCVAMDDGDGGIVEISEYEELLGMTGAEMFTLALNDDNSVSLVSFGEDITSELGTSVTWEANGDTVTISCDGESLSLTYDSESKRLGLEIEGSLLYFEKL